MRLETKIKIKIIIKRFLLSFFLALINFFTILGIIVYGFSRFFKSQDESFLEYFISSIYLDIIISLALIIGFYIIIARQSLNKKTKTFIVLSIFIVEIIIYLFPRMIELIIGFGIEADFMHRLFFWLGF